MRILIADDDKEIVRVLGMALRASGFEISTAGEAMRVFQSAKKELPDAILLDISMPGGNGLDVLSLLKASPSTRLIPVIVISANADPEMPQKAKALGAAAYIAKPFEIGQVQDALDKIVGKPGAAT